MVRAVCLALPPPLPGYLGVATASAMRTADVAGIGWLDGGDQDRLSADLAHDQGFSISSIRWSVCLRLLVCFLAR